MKVRTKKSKGMSRGKRTGNDKVKSKGITSAMVRATAGARARERVRARSSKWQR